MSLDGRRDLTGQVYTQLREAIVGGALRPGDRLPATRELADRLAVSRTTVTVAYDRLMGEGFLVAQVGAGTFVSDDVGVGRTRRRAPRRAHSGHGRCGRRSACRSRRRGASIRLPLRAARRRPLPVRHLAPVAGTANEPGGCGRVQLRRAGRPPRAACGDRPPPRRVAGRQGVRRRHHRDQRHPAGAGPRRPRPPGARRARRRRGSRLPAGPVVAPHARPRRRAPCRSTSRASSSMPSRPTPAPCWSRRRTSSRSGTRCPCGAGWPCCAGPMLMTGRSSRTTTTASSASPAGRSSRCRTSTPAAACLYTGSFSKTLLPSLRLGFVVVPASLRPAMHAAKYVTDWSSSTPQQLALAELIDRGWFARHLRAMRTTLPRAPSAPDLHPPRRAVHRRPPRRCRPVPGCTSAPSPYGMTRRRVHGSSSTPLQPGCGRYALGSFGAARATAAAWCIGYGADPARRTSPPASMRLRAAFAA